MSDIPGRLGAALAGRYSIERELGHGGMATVYLARDLKHGRDVALKVLRPELGAVMGAERFLSEIQTTAQLRHPHILPLFDSGDAAGSLYYVMPLVEGESLRDCLRREHQLPLERALAIAAEIGSALDYAHKRGVVHRDLKPENILLSEGGALLADFGIALPGGRDESTRLTETGLSVGTPQYMSPEQAAGERSLNGQSDLFSLGVVTYEMLAGEPPFTGPTAQAVIVKLMVEQPPALATRRPGLPAGVDAALRWALAKEPADRPATAAAFVTALRAPAATPTAAGPPRSIAVLPFANMSADPDNEFFADGIAEEIINALTRLPGLRVAARISAFSFKGKNEDLRSIGEKLKVASVLEGSVRRAGNRLRITAQLVTVADGFHQWSERYDRELTDVFDIQDEITTAIVERLKLTFNRQSGSLVQPGTENVDAYQLCHKGRALLYRRGLNIERARECFEQALTIDPRYALAHAGLADALIYLAMWGVRPSAEVIPRARIAAARALELEPGLAEAHYATAVIAYFHDYDIATFTREFARAVELKPAYTQARCGRALYDLCNFRADYDSAAAASAGAVKDDPLSAYAATTHAMILGQAGRLPEAIVEARRATELDPDSVVAWWHLSRILGRSGDHPGAVQAGETALALFPQFSWAAATLVAEYGRVGDRPTAERLYAAMTARAAEGYVQPTMLATAATGCGRLEEGLALLTRAVEEHDGVAATMLKSMPELEPLRRLPGYRHLLQRIGWGDTATTITGAPDAD
ncbi:MAG TPA: protein kinase [Gemmatimonadales bacterium]|nr:protein kinase [Gemmatimonadales bacterium]